MAIRFQMKHSSVPYTVLLESIFSNLTNIYMDLNIDVDIAVVGGFIMMSEANVLKGDPGKKRSKYKISSLHLAESTHLMVSSPCCIRHKYYFKLTYSNIQEELLH